MRLTLLTLAATLAAPTLAAVGTKFQMCKWSDCTECEDKTYYYGDDTGTICVDTDGRFKSAWMWPASEIEGATAMVGLWSDRGGGSTDCGYKDVQTGCSSRKVGSDGSCMEFMHPQGELPPQMAFQFGTSCFAG